MQFKAESILPSPSLNRISNFERNCRVLLPAEYKEFLRKYNGAIPIKNLLKTSSREFLIEKFLCLLDNYKEDEVNGDYDLEVVITQLDLRLIDDEDLVGWNMIPIAALFAGDFVCLDFRESKNPKVVVWLHEESDELEPVVIEIASNIAEFFNMLC